MVFITGCVRLFHRKRPALTPFAQFLTHLLLQRIRCYPSALLKCSGRRLGTQTLPAVWSTLWGANEAPQYDRLTKRTSFVSGKMGLCVTPTLKWTQTSNQTKIVVHACYKHSFLAWCLKKKIISWGVSGLFEELGATLCLQSWTIRSLNNWDLLMSFSNLIILLFRVQEHLA